MARRPALRFRRIVMGRVLPLVQMAVASIAVAAGFAMASVMAADAPSPACDLSAYKAVSGLVASNAADGLRLTWDGEKDQQLRLRLGIDGGTPTVRELALRRRNG